jgi:hypothetical protein
MQLAVASGLGGWVYGWTGKGLPQNAGQGSLIQFRDGRPLGRRKKAIMLHYVLYETVVANFGMKDDCVDDQREHLDRALGKANRYHYHAYVLNASIQ